MSEEVQIVKFNGEEFEQFHGSPFDRGSADSYYGRGESPHWYPNGSYNEPKITSENMSSKELRAYFAGYQYNEESGVKKEWY